MTSPPKVKEKSTGSGAKDELRKCTRSFGALNMIPELEVVDYTKNSPNRDVQTIMVETERCSKSRLDRRACPSENDEE